MIKINLARNQSYSAASTQTAIKMDQALFSSGANPVAKVILILGFVAALYYYESHVVSQKTAQLVQLNEQASMLEREGSQLGSITNVVRELGKQKEILGKQLDVIRQISQKRAYKMQAIDYLQNHMPKDLWLKKMDLSKNIIHLEGFSRSPFSIQKLVSDMEKTDFISTAINKELSRGEVAGEELNTFDIEARVKL